MNGLPRAPEEIIFQPGVVAKRDMPLICLVEAKQLPKELAGAEWPPKS